MLLFLKANVTPTLHPSDFSIYLFIVYLFVYFYFVSFSRFIVFVLSFYSFPFITV